MRKLEHKFRMIAQLIANDQRKRDYRAINTWQITFHRAKGTLQSPLSS